MDHLLIIEQYKMVRARMAEHEKAIWQIQQVIVVGIAAVCAFMLSNPGSTIRLWGRLIWAIPYMLAVYGWCRHIVESRGVQEAGRYSRYLESKYPSGNWIGWDTRIATREDATRKVATRGAPREIRYFIPFWVVVTALTCVLPFVGVKELSTKNGPINILDEVIAAALGVLAATVVIHYYLRRRHRLEDEHEPLPGPQQLVTGAAT
jgi:hypothetical protein